MNKYIILSTSILLIASLVAWYQPNFYNSSYVTIITAYCEKIPILQPLVKYFKSLDIQPTENQEIQETLEEQHISASSSVHIFTKEELSKYKGENDKKIYLALMGKVFDVSKGKDFYGPGGGYHFFTGIDGSRAFVSGDFTPAGLSDDITGLDSKDYLGLKEWSQFYMNDYTYIGKVQGLYYDSDGNPTDYLQQVESWIQEAVRSREEEDKFKEKYPMCNIDYKPQEGTTVWCSKSSGGVHRDWVGFPRSLYSAADSKNVRCACAQNQDLNDPMLKEYPNCVSDSIVCKLSN